MKVILLRDTAKLGKRGDIKEVSEGYAMNVLIKKGEAVYATPEAIAQWKAKEGAKIHKKEIESNTFVALVDALQRNLITIEKKHDEKGQLFAAVKEVDIADAIFSTTKLSIDPKQIIIMTHIKSVGKHTFFIKQGERKEKIDLLVR